MYADTRSAVLLQVDGCSTKLAPGKAYCMRYRVCQQHLSAPMVLINNTQSRFCQQCGRFQELEEFDGPKRCAQDGLSSSTILAGCIPQEPRLWLTIKSARSEECTDAFVADDLPCYRQGQ